MGASGLGVTVTQAPSGTAQRSSANFMGWSSLNVSHLLSLLTTKIQA